MSNQRLNLSMKPRSKRRPFKKNKDLMAYWLERFYRRLMIRYLQAQRRGAKKRKEMDFLNQVQAKFAPIKEKPGHEIR